MLPLTTTAAYRPPAGSGSLNSTPSSVIRRSQSAMAPVLSWSVVFDVGVSGLRLGRRRQFGEARHRGVSHLGVVGVESSTHPDAADHRAGGHQWEPAGHEEQLGIGAEGAVQDLVVQQPLLQVVGGGRRQDGGRLRLAEGAAIGVRRRSSVGATATMSPAASVTTIAQFIPMAWHSARPASIAAAAAG